MNLSRTIGTMALFVILSGCDTAEKAEKNEAAPPPKSSSSYSNPTVGGTAQAVRGAVYRSVSQSDLHQIGLTYEAYRTTNGKAPANLDDLDLKRDAPKIHGLIKAGDIVIIWNAERSPDAILGYEKQEGPTGTRVVLLGNGTVKTMDAQEFETTPKAKGK